MSKHNPTTDSENEMMRLLAMTFIKGHAKEEFLAMFDEDARPLIEELLNRQNPCAFHPSETPVEIFEKVLADAKQGPSPVLFGGRCHI